MDAVPVPGEVLAVPERVIVAPTVGVFRPLGDTDVDLTEAGDRTLIAAGQAIGAGTAAIRSAVITPGDLSMVIVATCTPEQPIPETSSFVAEGLGVRCGAFDVGAACAGFSYGLVVAGGLVATGANGPI